MVVYSPWRRAALGLPHVTMLLALASCGSAAEHLPQAKDQGRPPEAPQVATASPASLEGAGHDEYRDADDLASLSLTVTDFRSNGGQVCAAVFDSPVGFPDKEAGMVARRCGPIGQALLLPSLPTDKTIAVSVFHDKNMNGQLDTRDLAGLKAPSEGYGFSRNPGLTIGAPKFDAVALTLSPGSNQTTINLIYIFGG